jgi:hypothetical protein
MICLLCAGCRLAAAISAAGSAWVLLFARGEQLVQEWCWSNLADKRATGNNAQRTRPHSAAMQGICRPSAALLLCAHLQCCNAPANFDGRCVGWALAGLLHAGTCRICSLAWLSSRSDALAVVDSHGRLCVLAAAGGVLERLQLMDTVRPCCSLRRVCVGWRVAALLPALLFVCCHTCLQASMPAALLSWQGCYNQCGAARVSLAAARLA